MKDVYTRRKCSFQKRGKIMDDIIILVDENGEEQEYELLDTVE